MSLSAWEQDALDSIKNGLADADPALVARLAMFTRLASGEDMPVREKIQAVKQQVARRRRRMYQRLGWPGHGPGVAGHHAHADHGGASQQPRRRSPQLRRILCHVVRRPTAAPQPAQPARPPSLPEVSQPSRSRTRGMTCWPYSPTVVMS